jgi:hypothetical protein
VVYVAVIQHVDVEKAIVGLKENVVSFVKEILNKCFFISTQ